ncbi:MAG: hypothetical protein J5616_04485 [Bacteroidaceae bacterium]|nr:hypothetical protein [Bacteroidaceae bacterium]
MKGYTKYIISAAALALVVGGAAAVAYQMGKQQSVGEVAELNDEVERLRAGERDAAVVKRVSQQMEDIAYQQKSISDQQRDRAEEQSLLAMQNATRAEMESRAAHEAENKATAAAKEAEQERANAERQQQIAVEQRDEATHAKNVADTLNLRTQARILGVTSQVQREAGNGEVADLLAYTSWYFMKNNRGNQYFSDTFKALTQATNGVLRHRMRQNGAVNALAKMPGRKLQCVAVTNYGEVELLTASFGSGQRNSITSRTLLQNNTYDFRDVVVQGNWIYALSHKGPLCKLDEQGTLSTIPLPEDEYFRILPIGEKLLLAGRKSLVWYINGSGASLPIPLPKTLSAIVEREGKACLFYADGSYAEMKGSSANDIEGKTPLVKGVVTAAYYDKATQCLSVAVKDGNVYPINKYNRVVETLAAHRAICKDITMLGSTIVTGGYDKSIYIWHMDNMLFESGLSFSQEMNAKSVTKAQRNSKEIPTEWLVPVNYTYDGWVLAVCGDVDGKDLWIGTSAGSVMLMNSSADDMAQQLHKKLNRNLTETEWVRYVGMSIPYMKLK